jgi:ankyrin repeat protein
LIRESAPLSLCDRYHAVVVSLIEAGANVNQAQKKDGKTPLMAAADSNITKIIDLLLEAGADVHMKDNSGKTALDWAKRSAPHGDTDCVIRLRDAMNKQ